MYKLKAETIDLQGFFGDLSAFEIIAMSAQTLGVLGVVAALLFAWWNLRIIRQRMRLEMRPILKIDLKVLERAQYISDEQAPESLEESSCPRFLKFTIRNLQNNPAGTSLGAEIKFAFSTFINGKEHSKGVLHRLPVLEASEASDPTQLFKIEAVDRFVAQVVSVTYHDVDGNVYSRAHGAIHIEGGRRKKTITMWGELK